MLFSSFDTFLETALLYYVIGVNLIAFCMYGYDKWMARAGAWRIPEAILWITALIGGSVGSLAAMQFFRHKTKKISFQFVLMLIVVAQIGVGVLLYYWLSATPTPDPLQGL